MEKATTRRGQARSAGLPLALVAVKQFARWLRRIVTGHRPDGPAGSRAEDASGGLESLNERQIAEGATRLQADLKRLHAAGIIDRQGKRTATDLPVEMKKGSSEVV